MEVTVEIEKTENGHVDLAVAVPGSELENRKNSVLNSLQERIALPGFRKGHVPKAILEKRFGPQATAEGLDDLLKEAVQAAFEKQKINPVDTPKITDIKMDDGHVRFKVCVEIRPDLTVTDEQILKIPLPKSEGLTITDEDVTAAIDNERKTHATFQPELEIRPVRKGDFAVLDYEGFLKETDKPIDGAKAEGTMIEIGGGRFLPGFDEQIVGMNPGGKKRIEILFPADFYDEDLQGKAAYFHVTVQAIKKRQMPEISDDFAKEMGYDSVADMRSKIRAEMERGAKEMSLQGQRQALFSALDERISYDPPNSFIDRQAENLRRNLERQYKGGHKEMVERLAREGKSESDLETELRERARKQVKNSLILDAIAKKKNIRVTEEDLTAKINHLADQSQASADVIRGELEKQDRLDEVRYAILDEKVVQFLLDHADIR